MQTISICPAHREYNFQNLHSKRLVELENLIHRGRVKNKGHFLAGGADRTSTTKAWSGGNTAALASHILCRLCLTICRAGQCRRRCSRSPLTWWQVFARQWPSRLSVQNLLRLSVLYLPLIICARMVDLLTSWGLLPAVTQSGCGLVRECPCLHIIPSVIYIGIKTQNNTV